MAYRHSDFIPGAVPMACSICGRRRKFPDEIERSDDGLFRCLDSCMERTVFSVDQERAAWRPRPEQPPPPFGAPPHVNTFLEESQLLQAKRIPGWTPTTTFYDDFSILPGAIGSSWSTQLTGTGTIISPATGTVRLSGGTGTATVYAPSITVLSPGAGRFYSRVSFSLSSGNLLIGGATSTSAGAPAGVSNQVQVSTATIPQFLSSGGGVAFVRSSVLVDSTNEHVCETWWTGDGVRRTSVDCERPMLVATTLAMTSAVPWFRATSTGVIDITDAVFMV